MSFNKDNVKVGDVFLHRKYKNSNADFIILEIEHINDRIFEMKFKTLKFGNIDECTYSYEDLNKFYKKKVTDFTKIP